MNSLQLNCHYHQRGRRMGTWNASSHLWPTATVLISVNSRVRTGGIAIISAVSHNSITSLCRMRGNKVLLFVTTLPQMKLSTTDGGSCKLPAPSLSCTLKQMLWLDNKNQQSASIFFELWLLIMKLCSTNKLFLFNQRYFYINYQFWLHKHKFLSY